ncbi:hypothetical protein D3C79_730080 [compost metagenome]
MAVLVFIISAAGCAPHQVDEHLVGGAVAGAFKQQRDAFLPLLVGQRAPTVHDLVIVPDHVLRELLVHLAQGRDVPVHPVIPAVDVQQVLLDAGFVVAVAFLVVGQQGLLVFFQPFPDIQEAVFLVGVDVHLVATADDELRALVDQLLVQQRPGAGTAVGADRVVAAVETEGQGFGIDRRGDEVFRRVGADFGAPTDDQVVGFAADQGIVIGALRLQASHCKDTGEVAVEAEFLRLDEHRLDLVFFQEIGHGQLIQALQVAAQRRGGDHQHPLAGHVHAKPQANAGWRDRTDDRGAGQLGVLAFVGGGVQELGHGRFPYQVKLLSRQVKRIGLVLPLCVVLRAGRCSSTARLAAAGLGR